MCEVTPSLLPYETAFASEFASTTAIDLAHRASPRYGNPTDVTLLVIGNEEDQKAYLIGVFSGAITIFIFAMIWVLLLIYFKVRGPKRYGWLSGSRDPLPPNPLLADPRNHDLRLVAIDASRMLNESRQENSQVMTTIASVSSREHSDAPTTCEIEERLPPTKDRHEQGDQDIFAGWVASYLAQHIQNERMRVIVFLSTLGIVIADILMLLNGLPGLNLALDSARQALATAEDITDNAYQIASRLIASTEDMSTAFLDFLERFSGICPELQDSLCDNWDNWESCALEGVLGDEVDMPLDWVFEHFSSNQTMALDQANEAQDLIVNIRNTLQTTDNTLGKVEGLFQMSSIFSILLMCLCGFIMASILCRSPRLTAQWQQRCFFPLFMLLVLVAFSFSITFVVTSTVAADACFGSPDEKLLMVLENELSSMRPFTAEIALYVVSECRLSPPSALQEYLVEGSNLLADLQPEFLNTTSHFEQVCGEVNNTNWQDSARTTSNLLCSVSDTVSELRDLFECPNWYPLYESTVHDTFCYSVDSLSWIAFTQFFVMCLAMIVITCRASIFQRIEIEQVGVADSTGLREAGDDHGFEDEPSPAGRIEWAVPVGAFYNEDDDDDTIIAAWQTETDVGEVAISSSSSSPEDGGMDPETTEDPCWKPVEVYEA